MAHKALAVTRPLFEGRIVAFSYVNYSQGPTPRFWTDVVYKGYDLIRFSAFPACDLQTTDAYMDGQLTNDLTVVLRDSIPWLLGELTLQEPWFAACGQGGETFRALKDDIFFGLVVAKLDSLAPPPSGVMVRADPPPDDPPEVLSVQTGSFSARQPGRGGDRRARRQGQQAGCVIFTSIQEFLPEEKSDLHPALSTCRNIVVLADEAQAGDSLRFQRLSAAPAGRTDSRASSGAGGWPPSISSSISSTVAGSRSRS